MKQIAKGIAAAAFLVAATAGAATAEEPRAALEFVDFDECSMMSQFVKTATGEKIFLKPADVESRADEMVARMENGDAQAEIEYAEIQLQRYARFGARPTRCAMM